MTSEPSGVVARESWVCRGIDYSDADQAGIHGFVHPAFARVVLAAAAGVRAGRVK